MYFMGQNDLLLPIKVDFSESAVYYDRTFSGVFLVICGKTEVSSSNWNEGDERAADYVKTIIKLVLTQELQKCSNKGIAMKKLMNEAPALQMACVSELMNKGFQVMDFQINSIKPNDDNLTTVNMLDLENVMANDEDVKNWKRPTPAHTTVHRSALDDKTESGYPKFCPGCGTSTTGTSFCAICGKKLKY